MIEIIALIAKLLSGNFFGSIIGWVGGLMNRKLDLEAKRIDIQFERDKLAHELNLRDKDNETMKLELAGKERVSVIETEGATNVAAYSALAASYAQEAAIVAGPKMTAFTKFIRPFATLWFLLISTVGSAWILWTALYVYNVQLSLESWTDLMTYVIQWSFFQASVCIGWWFANRPSGSEPKLPSPQQRVG